MKAYNFFDSNFILACEYNSSIELSVHGSKYGFLIDSGASLSAVQYDTVLQWNIPVHDHCININGIGGKVQTIGYVYITLNIGGQDFLHKFYVIKSLPCLQHGIIGRDFLQNYKAILNYENNTISFDNAVTLPMNNGSLKESYLCIPPRCEKLFWIDSNAREECVILPDELCQGVLMAGIICKPTNGKICIQLLNTRETEVKLSYFRPEIHSLSEYNICNFEKDDAVNGDRVRELFKHINLSHLNSEERSTIESICAKFSDVFHLPNDKLTTCNLYDQTIHLQPNAEPVYTKQYRLPFSQREEIEKQINKMLSDNIIEPTKSEWSSPILLVPKKSDNNSKKWRLVVDYRKLNCKILDDKFPLPNISDILDSLSGAMYLSQLDLSQAYYQANLKPDCRKYTAFTTPSGQYQMTRLPMGLKISPSAFSRLMTVAMSGLAYEKLFIYLDNLICFGRSLTLHNQNLIDILTRLRKVNLKLNPEKCDFLKKEMQFLGHVISPQGIRPDPEKIAVVQNYPIPQNADESKRFVAFTNYYRKFIPKFAELSLPLNKLSRKNASFKWTTECQKSFDSLKNALISPPILQYPNFDDKNVFILQTDASGYAIGSVLCNSDNRPIAFASRNLNTAEIRYPTIEKELLAIVWSVKYFRPYLYGRRFIIKTDHKPLIYLFNMTNPSSRLTKFRLTLEEYDYDIEYVRGADNVAADALSRIRISSEDLKDMNEHVLCVLTRGQVKKLSERKLQDECDNPITDEDTTNDWTDHPNVVSELKEPKECTKLYFTNKEEWKEIIKIAENRNNLFAFDASKSIIYVNPLFRSYCARDAFVRKLGLFCKQLEKDYVYIIKDNFNIEIIKELTQTINSIPNWSGPRVCILRGVKEIIDQDTRRVILNDYHMLPSSGHAGIRRMINNIRKRYFWPGLEKDVTEFVNRCDKCLRQKHFKYIKEPMVITDTGCSAFDRVYLDIVGPLVKDIDSNLYILTLQCDLTKYVEAYPLRNKDTISVAAAFVNNFILRYGIPSKIISDRGTEFVSRVMAEVCKILNIKQITSTAYHHQSIGSLENSHKNLMSFLRIQTENDPHHWSSWLPFWCFAFNTTVHTETKYTPYELVFGKLCNLPSNLTSDINPLYNHYDYPQQLRYRLQKSQYEARNNLIVSKEQRKTKYDNYTNSIKYNVGDKILLKNEQCVNKFSPLYIGPFNVIEDCEPNLKIEYKGKQMLIHKNRTRPYTL